MDRGALKQTSQFFDFFAQLICMALSFWFGLSLHKEVIILVASWEKGSPIPACMCRLQRKLHGGFCLPSLFSAFILPLSLLCIYLERLS